MTQRALFMFVIVATKQTLLLSQCPKLTSVLDTAGAIGLQKRRISEKALLLYHMNGNPKLYIGFIGCDKKLLN